jgi:excisionase family DNA binding protein
MKAHLRAAPAPNPDPWLTLQEAAAELKLSDQTLRLAVAQGRLRAARVNGNHGPYRIRRSWLDAYLEHAATGGPWLAPPPRVR